MSGRQAIVDDALCACAADGHLDWGLAAPTQNRDRYGHHVAALWMLRRYW
jgi:hypothetical protein